MGAAMTELTTTEVREFFDRIISQFSAQERELAALRSQIGDIRARLGFALPQEPPHESLG